MELYLPELFPTENFIYDRLIEELYQIYFENIMNYDLKFKDYPVRTNENIIEGIYCEGFWHIVTKCISFSDKTRLVDYRRAERIVWINPLIIQFDFPEILYWVEETIKSNNKKTIKHYLYYEHGQFLIVLEKRYNYFFMNTAFYVDSYNRKKYRKKYEKYKS